MSQSPGARPWHLSLNRLRWMTLVLPPLALFLLWLTPNVTRRERFLGTLGIPLFSLLHVAALVWGMHALFGIDFYEWRGGYTPVLTFSPTRPDFDALEANRRNQRSARSADPPPAESASWAGFRGSDRSGSYTGPRLNVDWDRMPPRLLWRQPVGGGYASFAVAHGLAFTVEQRRSREAAVAYDLATGHEVWVHDWDAEFHEPIGGDGPRATPAWHQNRLYALGAEGELRCLNAADGSLVWRHNILSETGAPVLEYGCSSSPLVVGDLVIVTPGAPGGKSIAAYHCLSGELRWSALNDPQAYVSPVALNAEGELQVVIVAAHRTLAIAPGDGRLLWDFAWGEPLKGRNVAQPVLWSGPSLLLSAGYGTGCVAFELERSPTGWHARELWRNKFLKNKFSSSVFSQGFIYGLDEDILTCLDAATGARQWKAGRYGYGQLVLADGHLILLCGNGDLALVRANPEQHQEIARIPGIHGKTWNHPAVAEGKLLIRNAVEMACFDMTGAREAR